MSIPEAVEKLLKTFILSNPEIEIADVDTFRQSQLYHSKVDFFFERNELLFKKIINKFNHGGRNCMTVTEAIYFV